MPRRIVDVDHEAHKSWESLEAFYFFAVLYFKIIVFLFDNSVFSCILGIQHFKAATISSMCIELVRPHLK